MSEVKDLFGVLFHGQLYEHKSPSLYIKDTTVKNHLVHLDLLVVCQTRECQWHILYKCVELVT